MQGGRWRSALGNSDTHLENQIGIPQTVVLAEGLSTDAVLAGIRAGRCWIVESAAVGLFLKATVGDRRAGIGERLETRGESAVILTKVRGVPSGAVSFHQTGVRSTRHHCPAADQALWSGGGSALLSAYLRPALRQHSGPLERFPSSVAARPGSCAATERLAGHRSSHLPRQRQTAYF